MAREGWAESDPENIEQAFLEDIARNPDDDAPRLIYADWLEDNGNPERAELIRLQIENAGKDAKEMGTLVWKRMRELEKKFFKGPDLVKLGNPISERGFINGIDYINFAEFEKQQEDILQKYPLLERIGIAFADDRNNPEEFFNNSFLNNITSLELHNLNENAARFLIDCSHLKNLKEISLSPGPEDDYRILMDILGASFLPQIINMHFHLGMLSADESENLIDAIVDSKNRFKNLKLITFEDARVRHNDQRRLQENFPSIEINFKK